MTLKSAALLALAGMILVAALRVIDLLIDISAVVNGLVPAIGFFRALIYAFASVGVAVFLYVFYRSQ